MIKSWISKGQLISKRFFEVVDSLQKTNENKSHTCKNEFVRSFFGGNRWPQKPFRNYLTFSTYRVEQQSLGMFKINSFLGCHTLIAFDFDIKTQVNFPIYGLGHSWEWVFTRYLSSFQLCRESTKIELYALLSFASILGKKREPRTSHCFYLDLNGQKTRGNFWCIPGILGTYTILKWKEFLKSPSQFWDNPIHPLSQAHGRSQWHSMNKFYSWLFFTTSNEIIWLQKISIFMHG